MLSACTGPLVGKYKNYDFEPILLNGDPLQYCKSLKYRGHITDELLNDNYDILRQMSVIHAIGNMLINFFKILTEHLQNVLFKTYTCICNFYSSQLCCDYKKPSYQKLKVSYNNVFRTFFQIG